MKPLAISPAIRENETARRGASNTASGPKTSNTWKRGADMSFDGHYSDSGRQIKPADAPILSAADIARCDAISARRGTPMMDIVRAVSEATGIPTTEIYGRSHARHISEARHLVMYLCYQKGMTLTQIGRLIGRDFSTVSQGIQAEKRRRGEA